MKKYIICFLLFLVACVGCVSAGYAITRSQVKIEAPIPNTEVETETVHEDQVVVNQKQVEPAVKTEPKTQYYLVVEDEFLLVFCDDKKTVCLYTHMPISDFPESEQAKLRQGIWFSNMLDVFNYLESYTS